MSILGHSLEKAGMVPVIGGEIHYRYYVPHNLDNSKKTPLLVIHGGPGNSHALMYDTLHSLADDRPVLFYDQLGSYFSPCINLTDDLLTLDRFTNEAVCLLDALKISKAILLGHSWGGTIAANLAIQTPERLEKVILSCPLISTQRWIEDCMKLADKIGLKEIIQTCETKGETTSEAYQKSETTFMAAYACRLPQKHEAQIAHGKKFNSEIYNRMWGPSEFTCSGNLKDIDLFPYLSTINTPTAILCGEYDMATPETMREAQELINGATLDIIKGSAHVAFVDGNEAYCATVRKILAI